MERALISVSDKTGVAAFAAGLVQMGVEILSTGGTARSLREAGVRVIDVAEYAGSPEILGGRVKTLHPRVHGGLLFKREDPDQVEEAKAHGILPIDMVVVNLYPFERTVARPDCPFDEAIENIDIGGPTMIRSAAKNHASVAVVTDPTDYQPLLNELALNGGVLSSDTRYRLAQKAFRHTAHYDMAISHYLERRVARPPRFYFGEYELAGTLASGENPHQEAAWYRICGCADGLGIADARIHHGAGLQYDDVLELDAALQMVREFSAPAAVLVVHHNPCGVATSIESLEDAFRAAWDCDPLAAYGCTVAFNRPVDVPLARLLNERPFVRSILAPQFPLDALSLLLRNAERRLAEHPAIISTVHLPHKNYRFLEGGLLVQDHDPFDPSQYEMRTVTQAQPSGGQQESLLFAFEVAKHVKSNAAVVARKTATVGIGAGQMTRTDAVQLALRKAGDRALGAVLAGDDAFPLADSVHAAADAGIAGIIQPGGGPNDAEVIAAADKRGLFMVFTGRKHLRH